MKKTLETILPESIITKVKELDLPQLAKLADLVHQQQAEKSGTSSTNLAEERKCSLEPFLAKLDLGISKKDDDIVVHFLAKVPLIQKKMQNILEQIEFARYAKTLWF